MDLQQLSIPYTFEESMALYKDYKRLVYNSWMNMKYDTLKAVEDQLYMKLKLISLNNDAKSLIRLAIGARVLGKLKPPYLQSILELLTSHLPIQDPVASDFTSFILAKFCKREFQKDQTFVLSLISKCSDWLSNSGPRHKLRAPMHLLGWIGSMSPSMLFTSAQQYIDALVIGICKQHVDARAPCFHILSGFLEKSHHGPLIAPVAMRAVVTLNNSKSPDRQHSSLLLLTLAANACPSYIASDLKNLMMLSYNLIQSRESYLSLAALRLMISLAPLDPVLYREKYGAVVAKALFKSGKLGQSRLSIPILHSFPDTLSMISSGIVTTVAQLFLTNDPSNVDSGFHILTEFSTSMPLEFGERHIEIAHAIKAAPLTVEYANRCQTLFEKSRTLWLKVEASLARKLISEFDSKPAVCLKIIKQCGRFSSANSEQLIKIALKYLTHKQIIVRKYTPAALIRLGDPKSTNFFDLVLTLLKRALCETEPSVRLEIVRCFDNNLECLALPDCLKIISVLIHDEAASVRNAVLLLLEKISYMNTIFVLPMIRQVFLDALFACYNSRTVTASAQTTRSLSIILKAAEPVLPVYVPVLIPIAMDFLRAKIKSSSNISKRNEKQTFFEIESINKIAVDFIDCISNAASICPHLFEDSLSEIITLFVDILETNSEKDILMAVLRALTSIVDANGLDILEKFPNLVESLYSFGSKTLSKKIHGMLIRILGRFGPKMPALDIKYDLFSSNISEVRTNNPDLFLQMTATALMDLIDDDTEIDLIYSAMVALGRSLYESDSMLILFHRFLRQLMKIVRTAPPDDTPRFFKLMKTVIAQHGELLKPFAEDFSNLLDEIYETQFFDDCLDILPGLCSKLEENFGAFLPHHIPILLEHLAKSSIDNPPRARAILRTLSAMAHYTHDFVFVLFTHVNVMIYDEATSKDVISSALQMIASLIKDGGCETYSAKIFRTFCFVNQKFSEDISIKSAASMMIRALEDNIGTTFDVFKSEMKPVMLVEETSLDFSLEEPPDITNLSTSSAFDEEQLIKGAMCPESENLSRWKDWFNKFVIVVISNSPSNVVSLSTQIAASNFKFALRLFHPAFLSCWLQMSDKARNIICNTFKNCIEDPTTPMAVLAPVVGLMEFMERSEERLHFPYLAMANAAVRSEKYPFALFCIHRELIEHPDCRDAFINCLDIYSLLNRDEDLRGMISGSKFPLEMTPHLAEMLQDWNTAAEMYAQDESDIALHLNALRNLHKYKEIAGFFGRFENLPGLAKRQAALSFAGAFLELGNWNNFQRAIVFAPSNSVDAIVMHAIAQAKSQMDPTSLIDEGFNLLAEKAGPLFEHGYISVAPYIVEAQQLVEISEFAKGATDKWLKRSEFARTSFSVIRPLYEMRIQLLDGEKKRDEILKFMKAARKVGNWELHNVYFNTYFSDFDEESYEPKVVYEHILGKVRRESKAKAIESLSKLIDRLPNGALKQKALYAKARFLFRNQDHNDEKSLSDALDAASKSDGHKAISLLAFTHIKLYNLRSGDRPEHAIAAIRCFVYLVKMESERCLPEVQQLASIIFRSGKYENVYEEVKDDIESVPLQSWLSALPQIFVQMDNPEPTIYNFVKDLIFKLLRKHRHATLFLLLFHIEAGSGAGTPQEILHQYEMENPSIVHGTTLFMEGLLSACNTRAELWHTALSMLSPHFKTGNIKAMRNILAPLIDELAFPKCDDDRFFAVEHGKRLSSLAAAFRGFIKVPGKPQLDALWKECRSFFLILKATIEQTLYIDVPAVSPQLSAVHDVDIAVPGTYQPGKEIIKIECVGRTMKVLKSKQHPKQVCIKGNNGVEFWHLLKGNEDLRLDERAMQFFNLINSILPPQFPSIVTYHVMPISTQVGLIQWITNTDTMSDIVKEYRTARSICIELEEKQLIDLTVPTVDSLRPIQRMEGLLEVSQRTPDTTLANIFWLSSSDSEHWLRSVTSFTQTTAVMSITGYMIGLGDRHPSNIMINKRSGCVVHIDLGDCFEATSERVMFPEMIPFRLTRFMCRALGPSGPLGLFSSTCEAVMKAIRNRRESVMAVLEIFVHAPISHDHNRDPSSNQKRDTSISVLMEANDEPENDSKAVSTIGRIAAKLSGKEESTKRSTKTQVRHLIQNAMDPYKLAHLYRGWNPLW